MGWNGCDSIVGPTHYVNLTFDLIHDRELGFSSSNFQSAIYQEKEGRLTWNERNVSLIRCLIYYAILISTMTWHGIFGFTRSNFKCLDQFICNKSYMNRQDGGQPVWPYLWLWQWIFKIKFYKWLYLRNHLRCSFSACYLSFIILGDGKQSRGDVRNVDISAVVILVYLGSSPACHLEQFPESYHSLNHNWQPLTLKRAESSIGLLSIVLFKENVFYGNWYLFDWENI